MQATQVETIRIVRRSRGIRCKAFHVQLRKSPGDVGEKPWPFGRGRRAEQLDRRGKLTVAAVDRQIDLVRADAPGSLR